METQTYVLSSRATTKITTEKRSPLSASTAIPEQEFEGDELVDVQEESAPDEAIFSCRMKIFEEE